MRRNRLIWLFLWILSLVGISFYGGAISYGICAVVSLIPFVSLAYLVYVYFFFHIYQKVDTKWPVARQTTPFYFTLVNDYFLLFSGIRVKYFSDFSTVTGLSEDTEYEFLPKTGITEETNVICHYRGEYKIGIETVIIQDYLRLFAISYKNPEPLKVTVKPRLVYLNELKDVDVTAAFNDSYANETEPDVLTKEYEYGDDIRQIHWGITAKTGKMMVRKRIGHKQQGIGIVFSTKRISDDIQSFLPAENKMLEVDLALSLMSVKQNIPVIHLHKNADLIEKNIARMEQFDEFYDYLSQVSFEESGAETIFDEVIESQLVMQCKTVFVIVQEWSEGLYRLLRTLNQGNVKVIVYVISLIKNDLFDATSLTNVKIIHILPEDELTEVM